MARPKANYETKSLKKTVRIKPSILKKIKEIEKEKKLNGIAEILENLVLNYKKDDDDELLGNSEKAS